MTPAEMGLSAVIALMGGGNVWNWLANRGKAKVDLIQLGQTISAEIIGALKAERQELIDKVDDLEKQIGELVEHIGSLEAALSKAGIKPPPRPVRRKAE